MITPFADSVFEGDTVRLAARVFDGRGAEVTDAPVTWTVDNANVAKLVEDGVLALLQPGTVRITATSGTAAATYDLVIGQLVVQRVDVTPEAISMARTDHLDVAAHAVGQGERPITGRTVTFTLDDPLVAIVAGQGSGGSTATADVVGVGRGSTTLRASVDGVMGTAHVDVVVMDTILTLTEYDGAPLPLLLAADSVLVDGVKELQEVLLDAGTLVLSGLLQRRYQLDVQESLYRVVRTGDTEHRELRFQVVLERDAGLVTVGAHGDLTMVSEVIGPHLEHTAALQSDGYLVHYHVAGTSTFLDLRYRRVTP